MNLRHVVSVAVTCLTIAAEAELAHRAASGGSARTTCRRASGGGSLGACRGSGSGRVVHGRGRRSRSSGAPFRDCRRADQAPYDRFRTVLVRNRRNARIMPDPPPASSPCCRCSSRAATGPGPSSPSASASRERTLRRDVDRLRELGYPVAAARGSAVATSSPPAPRSRRSCSTTTRPSRSSSGCTAATDDAVAGRGRVVGARAREDAHAPARHASDGEPTRCAPPRCSRRGATPARTIAPRGARRRRRRVP